MPALTAKARHIVGCSFLAEDVVQDVMLRLVSEEDTGKIDSAEAYLFRMVRNLAIDRARRLGIEKRIFTGEEAGAWCPASCTSSPEATLSGCQALRIVDTAMASLPERTRAIFQMHRLEGIPQKDIAERFGVSRALVCGLIRQAHDHCLAELEKHEWDGSGPAPDRPRTLPRCGALSSLARLQFGDEQSPGVGQLSQVSKPGSI
jgi:RNA polymerase sigma factor (sigma-70 family)